MYLSSFIHLSVGKHSGCLHILAIVNISAMNIRVHVSFWIIILSGCMPRSGIAITYGSYILSFLRNFHTVFYSGCASFSLVQFSCSVVSDSLWPHESQHSRSPSTSPTPRVHSNSRPSSGWCHPAISSSVVPFSSCLQSFPASGSFPMSVLWIRWPKYWSSSSSSSNEYSGLISFRMASTNPKWTWKDFSYE